MKFLLTLLVQMHLNQIAVGVLMLNNRNSAASINEAVQKIFESCYSRGNVPMAVFDMTQSISPFTWSHAYTIVNYNYNSKEKKKLINHLQSHSGNFHTSIIKHHETKFLSHKFLFYLENYFRFHKIIFILSNRQSLCHRDSYIKNFSTKLNNFDDTLYICRNNEQVIIFSVNYYTNWAPSPWKFQINSSEPWIFKQFVPNEKFKSCEWLFYQKPVKVNSAIKFNFKAIAKPFPPLMMLNSLENPSLNIKYQKYHDTIDEKILNLTVTPDTWDIFGGFDGKIMATIFKRINVAAEVIIYPENSTTVGYSLLDWKTMESNVLNNNSEINLNSRDLTYIRPNTVFINPIVQREITAVFNSRGYVAIPLRIRGIFKAPIIISAIIISGLVIFFFVYFNGRGFGRATLDSFSLILGFSIPKLPKHLATRMFFGSLIMYFIILSTTFQGNVTQILTVPLAKPKVDTLEDLENLGYRIYAGYSIAENFKLFQERICDFFIHDKEHCTEILFKDPLAACIDEAQYLQNEVSKNNNLQIIKQPVRTFFTTYLVMAKWPLRGRFEVLLSRLNEGGILQKWSNTHSQSQSLKSKRDDKKIFMTIGNMQMIFIILYTGLFISTVVWIGEVLFFRGYLARILINFHD